LRWDDWTTLREAGFRSVGGLLRGAHGMIVGLRRAVVMVLTCLAIAVTLANAQPAQPPAAEAKPALYYFVIDRSGSIRPNNLVIPIRGAMIQKLGEIPENSEVRLVLFNERAIGPRSWSPLTTNAV